MPLSLIMKVPVERQAKRAQMKVRVNNPMDWIMEEYNIVQILGKVIKVKKEIKIIKINRTVIICIKDKLTENAL